MPWTVLPTTIVPSPEIAFGEAALKLDGAAMLRRPISGLQRNGSIAPVE
jgi:hypothetical protein